VLGVLGSFGVILLLSRTGYEADKLDDFKGLSQRDPLLAFAMMMLMFSTAGVPPLLGFWAKLRIFQVLWETQHFWLVVIAAATSVVGAFYYLRVIWFMYFDPPTGDAPEVVRSTGVRVVLAVNAAAVFILGVMPSGLLDLCARLIH
jgi:NADH-quinone oxidoreductase subunit N